MADVAVIFHTQPSEMDDWDLARLKNWRDKAEQRAGNNSDD